jgi:hypothetical protein
MRAGEIDTQPQKRYDEPQHGYFNHPFDACPTANALLPKVRQRVWAVLFETADRGFEGSGDRHGGLSQAIQQLRNG